MKLILTALVIYVGAFALSACTKDEQPTPTTTVSESTTTVVHMPPTTIEVPTTTPTPCEGKINCFGMVNKSCDLYSSQAQLVAMAKELKFDHCLDLKAKDGTVSRLQGGFGPCATCVEE